ncbi:hypothetical protein [Kitasatospora sp. MAP5-34]|uniref:hypothetical protein n=1 Tax=Kitasatospora sp. MAP5-34 TaxID=3035102 RepID=UPI00247451BD|nr:hypothetical protein [Kitasatospora sp. MAP5-34]MDH6575373.1 hypothetical protein [Kitasatospora sp. MAP5-34]
MMKIEYLRTGPYVGRGREYRPAVDLATVGRGDLRWYYFLSDISFTVGAVDLTPPWSWTPVFDFLWSMKGVIGFLERGERSTVGFTENAELIEFVPEDGMVRVSCTYAPTEAVCSLGELKEAWLAFRQAVLTELGGEYPQLVGNPVLTELRL